MLEDMQLRGFSARTQGCYVAAVRQLADHYHRSPDQLTEEDLREYFLYLANDKKVARATAGRSSNTQKARSSRACSNSRKGGGEGGIRTTAGC
jgi:hypothetical protein